MYFRNFWKLLPSLFTLDFWFVNRKLKKLVKNHIVGAYEIDKAKKWATKHGYTWDNTWYIDGEKFLMKDNCCICMYSPYDNEFTRYYTHKRDYSEKKTANQTFLLNHNKTANFFFKYFLALESKKLYDREVKYYEMNKRISAEGKDYLESDDFLNDLHWLSMCNYYDLLDLRDNTNFSNKEKRDYIGDFYSLNKIDLNEYKAIEEDFNSKLWINDIILTATNKDGIDSVLVINPSKLYGVKITKDLLKKLYNRFFN